MTIVNRMVWQKRTGDTRPSLSCCMYQTE